MADIVFIKTYNVGTGKGARVKVFNLDAVIQEEEKLDRYIQCAKINAEFSEQICKIGIKTFEKIFSYEDIEILKEKGLLNYYPEGRARYGYFSERVLNKYPIFKKEVYIKYGKAFDSRDKLIKMEKKEMSRIDE